jgi:hypothetical protein
MMRLCCQNAHPWLHIINQLRLTRTAFILFLRDNVVADEFTPDNIFFLELDIKYPGQMLNDLHEFSDATAFLLPGQIRLPEITGEDHPAILADPGNDRIQLMETAVGKFIDEHVTVIQRDTPEKRG